MISAIKENCNNLVLMCFCFAETAGACPEQGPEGSESTTHHRCSAVYYPLPRERHFNWLITEREVFAFNTSRAQLITKGAKPPKLRTHQHSHIICQQLIDWHVRNRVGKCPQRKKNRAAQMTFPFLSRCTRNVKARPSFAPRCDNLR